MEENTLKRLLVNNLLGKLRQGWGREKKKGKGRKDLYRKNEGRKERKEGREGGGKIMANQPFIMEAHSGREDSGTKTQRLKVEGSLA